MNQFECEWTRKSMGGAIATILGTVGMYFAGRMIGTGIDYLPHINEAVARCVEHISGLDISENIKGLAGIIGGVVGYLGSGELRDYKTHRNILYRAYPIMSVNTPPRKPISRIDCEIPFPK